MLLWIKILLSGTLLSLVRTTPLNHCDAPCRDKVDIMNCARQPVQRPLAIAIEVPKVEAEKPQPQDRYTGKTYGFESFVPLSVESTSTSQRVFDTTIEEPINSQPAFRMGLGDFKKPSMHIQIDAVDRGAQGLGTLPISVLDPALQDVELRAEKPPKLLKGLFANIDKVVHPDGTTSNTMVSPCAIQSRLVTNAYGSCSCPT